MFHRPASRFRHRQRFSANLPAHLLHIVPEILQQNAGVRQKAFQPHHVGQHPQRAAKTQPIPSAEHPNDKTGVTLYKAVHGVAPLLAVKASHLYFTGRANASFILLVAAEGRAKLLRAFASYSFLTPRRIENSPTGQRESYAAVHTLLLLSTAPTERERDMHHHSFRAFVAFTFIAFTTTTAIFADTPPPPPTPSSGTS